MTCRGHTAGHIHLLSYSLNKSCPRAFAHTCFPACWFILRAPRDISTESSPAHPRLSTSLTRHQDFLAPQQSSPVPPFDLQNKELASGTRSPLRGVRWELSKCWLSEYMTPNTEPKGRF